jgi:hypothetical protein
MRSHNFSYDFRKFSLSFIDAVQHKIAATNNQLTLTFIRLMAIKNKTMWNGSRNLHATMHARLVFLNLKAQC